MFPAHITVELLNAQFNKNLSSHIGIEYLEIGSDFLTAKMPVDNRTKQPYGILHGGASVVLAESIGSLASNMLVDQTKQYCVGLEINANHIKSASSGFVFATVTPIHVGKKTHVWDIKIRNEQKELVCISRLTVAVIDRKP